MHGWLCGRVKGKSALRCFCGSFCASLLLLIVCGTRPCTCSHGTKPGQTGKEGSWVAISERFAEKAAKRPRKRLRHSCRNAESGALSAGNAAPAARDPRLAGNPPAKGMKLGDAEAYVVGSLLS